MDTIRSTTPDTSVTPHTPDTLSAWQRHSARSAVIRATLDHEAATRDGSHAWHTIAAPSGHFESADDLLQALQQAWLTRLTARLDPVLEHGADDLPRAVVAARAALAADEPSLARILERHRSEPALTVGVRTECRVLAVAAGLASFSESAAVAAERGARLLESTRLNAGSAPRDSRTGSCRNDPAREPLLRRRSRFTTRFRGVLERSTV